MIDNIQGTLASESPMFAMSGDGTDDVSIPMLFLFNLDGLKFLEALEKNPEMEVTLTDGSGKLFATNRLICDTQYLCF